MSKAVLGAIAGAVAGVIIPKRIVSIEMVYTTNGKFDNVILGICVDQQCNVTYVDADGSTNTVNMSANEIVIGRSVTVNSGRMFIMYAKYTGMI
jgi:hypothetical protein